MYMLHVFHFVLSSSMFLTSSSDSPVASAICAVVSLLKTVDIRSPKTVISVHFSYSLPMAMQIY